MRVRPNAAEPPISKFEYRNPKQYRNPKKKTRKILQVFYSNFGFVSDFEIRISDLSPHLAEKFKGKKEKEVPAGTLAFISADLPLQWEFQEAGDK
jgi:hypothetical protein